MHPSRLSLSALVLILAAGCSSSPQSRATRSDAPDSAVAAAPVADAVVASGPSREVTLEVGGMVCEACVTKVRTQLAKVPGVRDVEVSLADQRATIVCDAGVADTSLTRAVRAAGSNYIGLVLGR